MVNIKELLTDILEYQDLTTKTLESYIRPIIKVIESIPIHDLLVKNAKRTDSYGYFNG